MSDGGLTIEEFWAGIRAIPLVKPVRLTEDSFVATSRGGSPAQIPDPSKRSPAERQAVLELLQMRWADF